MFNTHFLDNRVSKNKCNAWTSVLLLGSIVNVKKILSLVFSNECNYIVSKEKIKIMSATNEEVIMYEYDKFSKD